MKVHYNFIIIFHKHTFMFFTLVNLSISPHWIRTCLGVEIALRNLKPSIGEFYDMDKNREEKTPMKKRPKTIRNKTCNPN